MKSLIHEPFGKWDLKNGLIDCRSTRIISRRRKNLLGKVLIASIVLTNNDSINHMDDY